MKILIVGHGYVGKASEELITEKYDVDVYDPKYGLAVSLGMKDVKKNGKWTDFVSKETKDSKVYDLAVICVPTKENVDGSCDVSLVESAIRETNAKIFLIKSTIEIGTTEKIMKETGKKIVFSPEYVGESAYFNPYFPSKMIETPFWIFGGEKEDTSWMIDFFLPILGPTKQFIQMTSTEAEIVKYMENSFFATKITFCQEMFDLCEKVGADWNMVREGWTADPRVGKMHTAVFRNKRGFSGKCLPKDTSALKFFMDWKGVDSSLMTAVIEKNKRLLEKETNE